MQRRNLLKLALALPLAGCGGGWQLGLGPIRGGGGSDGGSEVARGTVVGRVFVDPSGAPLVGEPPAGAISAERATLEIVVEGITGRSGSDGSFKLTKIPAGNRQLRITTAEGKSTELALTVIADAEVSLSPTSIPRAAAISRALAAVSASPDARIHAPQQPLPQGVQLSAADNSAAATALDAPTWLVFVDQQPGARFGHPTQFVLVDANTGAVRIQEQQFWPVLNGGHFYSGTEESPDLVQPGRTRAALVAPQGPLFPVPPRSRAHGPGKTLAVVVKGWARHDMKADVVHVPTLLGHGGIPLGTPTVLEPPHANKADVLAAWQAACLQATGEDVVFFYLSSHGSEQGFALLMTNKTQTSSTPLSDLAELPSGTIVVIDHLVPADLTPALKSCLACDVIIMIDTCYSGVWTSYFASYTPPRKGTTVTVLTAADSKHTSQGYSYQPVNGVYPANAGGAYTNAFLTAFSQIEAGSGGNEVSLVQAHNRAVANLSRDPDPNVVAQNPQLTNHVPASGSECDITLTPDTAQVIPSEHKSYDFEVRVDGEKPADGIYLYDFATAGTQGTLVSTTNPGSNAFRSNHAVVGYFPKDKAENGQSETITVKVYSNESTPRLLGSSSAKVTITTKPSVTISPTSSTIAPGASQSFTATVPSSAGASLIYKWSVTGSDLASLSDTKEGRAGKSFETTGATVTLATTPSTQGVLTVQVQAFESLSDGSRLSRGEAIALVTVDPKAAPSNYGQVHVTISNLTNHGIGVPTGEEIFKDYTLPCLAPVDYDPVRGLGYSSKYGYLPVSFFKIDANNGSAYQALTISNLAGTDLPHNILRGAVTVQLLYPNDVRHTDVISCDPQQLTTTVSGNRVDFSLTAKYWSYVSYPSPQRDTLGWTATVTVTGYFLTAQPIT